MHNIDMNDHHCFSLFFRVNNFFPRSDVGQVSLEKQEPNGCLYRSKSKEDENIANLLPRIISYFFIALNETKQKGFVKH